MFTPAFPALRVAVAAVFLLLVGVTATDLITQRDDQGERVAMIADTPAARTESVATEEAAGETGPAPAAPATTMQVADSEEAIQAPEPDLALPAQEPSEAFSQAAADDDSEVGNAGQATGAGPDVADEATPAPTPEPSPTAAEPESRIDAAEASNGLSNWRIAEIALLLLLFWLVVTWIGVERMRKR